MLHFMGANQLWHYKGVIDPCVALTTIPPECLNYHRCVTVCSGFNTEWRPYRKRKLALTITFVSQ